MSKRVLVVEDDEVTAFLTQRVLSESTFFHEVVFVVNGQEALDILRSQTFDVVLLDVSMPVLDGFTFLEVYAEECERNGHDEVPIVMLSSSDDPHEIRRAYSFTNVIAFELKPFSRAALARVSRLVGFVD
jgi:CheY-like chemotaxis protein